MTTIAQARAQLAEQGSRSLPEPELRQFLAIGAAVRAARTAVELVAALLQRASTAGQAECLAAVVQTTLNAHARGERVMLTVVDERTRAKLQQQLAELDLLSRSKLY